MKFVCAQCGSKYTIADEKVRRKILRIRCKKCNNIVQLDGIRAPRYSGAEGLPKKLGAPRVEAAPPRSAAKALDRGEVNAIVWFIAVQDVPVGPLSARKVRAHRRAGQVDDATPIWKEGMPDWTPLGSHSPLVELLAFIEDEASTRSAAPGESIVPASELAGERGSDNAIVSQTASGAELAFFHQPAADDDPRNHLVTTDSDVKSIQSLTPPRPGYGNQRLIMVAAIGFFIVALGTFGVVMFGGEDTGEAKTVETVEKVIERVVYRDRIVEVPVAAMPSNDDGKARKVHKGGRDAKSGAKRGSTRAVDVRTQELMQRFGKAGSTGGAPVAEKELGSPGSGGSPTALTANQVQGVVNRNKNQLKTCYERALRTGEAPDNRDLRADFKLVVGSSGVVKSVTVGGEAGGTVSLQRCLRGSVKRWMFPASTHPSPVEFPFLFTPR